MDSVDYPSFNFTPIAMVQSCYGDKFMTPRQPGLAPDAMGQIVCRQGIDLAAFDGLQNFSHIWVTFVFHRTIEQGWKPKVRPPRLGGNEKVGVFASRSNFRPNAIGLSVLKLEHIEQLNKRVQIHVSGLDLIDQTPILDIKPYLPYIDCQADAQSGFAHDAPAAQLHVTWKDEAQQQAENLHPKAVKIITQSLALDPRPAYQKQSIRTYSSSLLGAEIRWQIIDDASVEVLEIVRND